MDEYKVIQLVGPSDNMERDLNAAAQEGYEWVDQVNVSGNNLAFAILKRPKATTAGKEWVESLDKPAGF